MRFVRGRGRDRAARLPLRERHRGFPHSHHKIAAPALRRRGRFQRGGRGTDALVRRAGARRSGAERLLRAVASWSHRLRRASPRLARVGQNRALRRLSPPRSPRSCRRGPDERPAGAPHPSLPSARLQLSEIKRGRAGPRSYATRSECSTARAARLPRPIPARVAVPHARRPERAARAQRRAQSAVRWVCACDCAAPRHVRRPPRLR